MAEADAPASVHLAELHNDPFGRWLSAEEVDQLAVEGEGGTDDDDGDRCGDRDQKPAPRCCASTPADVEPVGVVQWIPERCEAFGKDVRLLDHRVTSFVERCSRSAARAWLSAAATVPSLIPPTSAISA
jgi:hypothetical protein